MENINGNTTILATGGHAWRWDGPATVGKAVGTVGVKGVFSSVMSIGARRGMIGAPSGGASARGALLKAADDAALNVLEAVFEDLQQSGDEAAWEDARARNKPLRFSFGRADREYKDRWCNPVPVYQA